MDRAGLSGIDPWKHQKEGRLAIRSYAGKMAKRAAILRGCRFSFYGIIKEVPFAPFLLVPGMTTFFLRLSSGWAQRESLREAVATAQEIGQEMSILKKTALLSVLVIAGTLLKTNVTTADLEKIDPLATTTVAIPVSKPDALDLWINKLAFAESSNREHIVVVDVNGKKSYGCLQYQMGTWKAFTKKYGMEADIMNCTAQKKLTRLIITQEKNGYRHWLNSTKKIGKPPVIVLASFSAPK